MAFDHQKAEKRLTLQKLSRFTELMYENEDKALEVGIRSLAEGPEVRRALVIRGRDHAAANARPELTRMMGLQEIKLQKHDPERKQDWKDAPPAQLLRRLRMAADELEYAIEEGKMVGLKAADVANYAMMIADLHGELEDV